MSPAAASPAREAPAWSTARLMVVDVDAHLAVTDQRILPETVAVLELARAAGHDVLVTSGRSLSGMLRLAGRLGLREGYAACSHGALTVRLDPAMPGGYELLDAVTFDLEELILQLGDLDLLSATLIAAEDPGAGWRVNRRSETGFLSGAQEQVSLARLRGETTCQARLHGPGISQYTDALAALTGLTVTATGPDSCDVTGTGTSLTAAGGTVAARLGAPAHTVTTARDSLLHSLTPLIPPGALQPGLSPLAAQLTAAVATAHAKAAGQESGPETVVRVWHGDDVYLAGVEVWTERRHGWVRNAPIPAGRGATMREIERAALDAGLDVPRGSEGRRRLQWRTTSDIAKHEDRPAGFELPVARA